jgi:branched-subunit amino acid aminotransferase/4-amino-4-deoxychorismate lyase
MTVGDLAGAEEAFVTSTTSDVCPVIRLDGRPVADGRIGPVTRRLMALFAERLRRETAGPPA